MSAAPGALSDSVAAALRTLIAERRYCSGDRLPPERELAAALRVSRASVREGISRLAQERTVVARRGSGTFVAPVSLGHVFEVRLQLEPFAAASAAKFRTDEEMDALHRLAEELGAAIDEPVEFAAIDARLHMIIARASGNSVLVDVLERLAVLSELSRVMTSLERATRAETLGHFHRVISAIDRQDGRAASAAMRAHLNQVSRAASRHVEPSIGAPV